jgi:hypothetical protein
MKKLRILKLNEEHVTDQKVGKNFLGKSSFARKDGSLGKTSGRNLLHLSSSGFNGNNSEDLLPRQVALLMMFRNSEVLERDLS